MSASGQSNRDGRPPGAVSDGRPQTALRIWAAPTVTGVALMVAVFALSTPGVAVWGAGFATVAQVWIESGGVAAAWLLGALGLGRIVRPLLRPSVVEASASPHAQSGGWTIQFAAGVAIMLWASHALGVVGLLGSRFSMLYAWAPILLGLLSLFDQIRRKENRPELWGAVPPSALLAIPGVAILVVAACAPPGTLWSSEAHGYDTLSYHLQLPRQWLEGALIAPLTHNVYSSLPSHVEAAFTHLAAMLAPGARALTDDIGRGVFAAQILHAMLTIASAASVGRLVALLLARAENGTAFASRSSVRAGGFAAATLLLTPWVLVVGSMAYSEMAVILMLVGALVVAREESISPARRAAIIGVLMGAAVGAKLTAVYMAVPIVAIALVVWTPRRTWFIALSLAACAGMLYLAPYLIRNAIALGNPLFPFGSSLLGQAHWSADQVARWNAAHHASSSVFDRVQVLAGTHRGALHPQWFIFFPMSLIGATIAILDRSLRRPAILLTVALALQTLAWMTIGHLQARFLLPAAPIGAVLIGLGAAAILRAHAKWIIVLILAQIALAAASTLNFLGQNNGHPNLALVGGVGAINGAIAGATLPRLNASERRELLDSLGPPAVINLAFDESSSAPSQRRDFMVYLLGDAAAFYYRVPVLYNTTWDAWPLAESLRLHNHEIEKAIADLRRRGVTHILVNLDEVTRLHADGWSDPLITPELAQRIVNEGGVVVWQWSAQRTAGVYLVEISRKTPGDPQPQIHPKTPPTDSMP